MNIRFEYLYRDAGNFKNWGEVIFANKNNLDAKKLVECARKVLIDEEFFSAEKAEVQNLQFKERIEDLDHEWHEFNSFTPTMMEPNDLRGRDVAEFMEFLEYASKIHTTSFSNSNSLTI